MHHTKLYTVGIVILQTALLAVVVFSAYVGKEETEVLFLLAGWIVFQTSYVAVCCTIVLELFILGGTGCFPHVFQHQVPVFGKLPVHLGNDALVTYLAEIEVGITILFRVRTDTVNHLIHDLLGCNLHSVEIIVCMVVIHIPLQLAKVQFLTESEESAVLSLGLCAVRIRPAGLQFHSSVLELCSAWNDSAKFT